MNSIEFLKKHHMSQRRIAELIGVPEVTVSNAATTGNITQSLQRTLASLVLAVEYDKDIECLTDVLQEQNWKLVEDDCLGNGVRNRSIYFSTPGYGKIRIAFLDDDGDGRHFTFKLIEAGEVYGHRNDL